MATLTSSQMREYNPSEKWSKPMDDSRRTLNKASSNNYSRDGNTLERTVSKIHHKNYSEHNMNFTTARPSEETDFDDEEEIVDKNDNLRPTGIPYSKSFPRYNDDVFRRKQEQIHNRPDMNVTDAVVAVQKLHKLKELQRRRDFSERYYSQEIRKLIGEHYSGPRMTMPTLRINQKLQSPSFRFYPGEESKNSLEPCGTMTTITRLDCGCIQETTRPIFTTAKGRVQKKTCSQSQDEVLLKLTSSNPQEHLYSSVGPYKERGCVKSKKRLSLNPRVYTEIPDDLNRDVRTENNQRNNAQQSQEPERGSRNSSPVRKFSETSTTSI